ncbi:MAG: glycosyltransferase family 1 protein, partial [Nitrososphaeraceae archaeon]|nr:glycosyltransferase family 1 protein [Nitrososphaeraceae archaeon]
SVKYKLFYSGLRDTLPRYSWMRESNVELVYSRIPNKILFGASRFLNRPFLDKMLKGVDVFFSPHFYIAPLSQKTKRVVTFHDLSFLHHPQFFSFDRNLWNNFQMNPRAQAKKADKIIAISNSTANDLVEKYEVSESKIKVIHSGVLEKFKVLDGDEINRVRHKYGLPEKFIFYLGTIEPRKNISGIIDAFEILKRDFGFEDHFLVIAGSRGWLYKDIFRKMRQAQFGEYIKYIDVVDDDDRPGLYNAAELLVYPSFFEGFGFQPLEAMACGTPVVASDNSSIPEVVHDAALLIDPYNIKEIYLAMKNILLDEKLKDRLIKKGFKRAENFSWNKTAAETLALLMDTR